MRATPLAGIVSLSRFSDILSVPDIIGSLSDAAREAFEEAKEEFTRDLTSDESKRAWICQQSTMDDVVQTVMQAQSEYGNRTSSKARKWLSIFSARVTYYGAVLDVLVQQHPEYVSLAWGAMKFLFVVGMYRPCPTYLMTNVKTSGHHEPRRTPSPTRQSTLSHS
jgi:hypothetical protein